MNEKVTFKLLENKNYNGSGSDKAQLLLKQYELLTNTANVYAQRRITQHRFFSVFIGAMLSFLIVKETSAPKGILLSGLTFVFCICWLMMTKNQKKIDTFHFECVVAMEEHLYMRPWTIAARWVDAGKLIRPQKIEIIIIQLLSSFSLILCVYYSLDFLGLI